MKFNGHWQKEINWQNYDWSTYIMFQIYLYRGYIFYMNNLKYLLDIFIHFAILNQS